MFREMLDLRAHVQPRTLRRQHSTKKTTNVIYKVHANLALGEGGDREGCLGVDILFGEVYRMWSRCRCDVCVDWGRESGPTLAVTMTTTRVDRLRSVCTFRSRF